MMDLSKIPTKELVDELAKRIAVLEGQVQAQPRKRFIPEDSNGKLIESNCSND